MGTSDLAAEDDLDNERTTEGSAGTDGSTGVDCGAAAAGLVVTCGVIGAAAGTVTGRATRVVCDAVWSAASAASPRSRLMRDSRDSYGSDNWPGVPRLPVFRRRGGIGGVHLMNPRETLRLRACKKTKHPKRHPNPPRPREEDERGRRDTREGESPPPRDTPTTPNAWAARDGTRSVGDRLRILRPIVLQPTEGT